MTMSNTNPGKISQYQNGYATDVHRTRTSLVENIPNAQKSGPHKFIQMVNVDKTQCMSQNKLPIISDVFSCPAPEISGQDTVLSSQDSIAPMAVHKNNTRNNDIDVTTQKVSNNSSSSNSSSPLLESRNVFRHALNSRFNLLPVSAYRNKFHTIQKSKMKDIHPLCTVNSDLHYDFNYSIPSLLTQYGNTNGINTSFSSSGQGTNNQVSERGDNNPVLLVSYLSYV